MIYSEWKEGENNVKNINNLIDRNFIKKINQNNFNYLMINYNNKLKIVNKIFMKEKSIKLKKF